MGISSDEAAIAIGNILSRIRADKGFLVQGYSMGRCSPHNCRVRLVNVPTVSLKPGHVVAFRTSDGRLLVHRIVHIGVRASNCGFLLTRGDTRRFPDPPVPKAAIKGIVQEILLDGQWQPFRAKRHRARLLWAWEAPIDALSAFVFEIDCRLLALLVRWASLLEIGWRDHRRAKTRQRWSKKHPGTRLHGDIIARIHPQRGEAQIANPP